MKALSAMHTKSSWLRHSITLQLPILEVGQIQDAPYDLSTGPSPRVILSPGFSFGAASYAWLAEHLAPYGFVVLSPEHHEHLDPENELWQATIQRPQDILALLDYVDEQVAPGGAFAGLIDPGRTAVVGQFIRRIHIPWQQPSKSKPVRLRIIVRRPSKLKNLAPGHAMCSCRWNV